MNADINRCVKWSTYLSCTYEVSLESDKLQPWEKKALPLPLILPLQEHWLLCEVSSCLGLTSNASLHIFKHSCMQTLSAYLVQKETGGDSEVRHPYHVKCMAKAKLISIKDMLDMGTGLKMKTVQHSTV